MASVISHDAPPPPPGVHGEERGNHAQGQLKYEVVAGKTALAYAYATYPLKFLHPRRTIRQGFDTFVTVRFRRLERERETEEPLRLSFSCDTFVSTKRPEMGERLIFFDMAD
jgi:hypothetical protein